MKVITIKQPYATLIQQGLKLYEFRTWKTKYRGDILIHAGQGIDKQAMKKYEYLNLDYPRGCIIARAKITDCLKIDDEMRKVLKEENEFIYQNVIEDKEFDGYGFKLEEIEEIRPIKVSGKLSLWDYDFKC